MARRSVKKQIEKKEASVYIGRPQPGLPQYTVFRDGAIPAHVERLIETNKAIAELIVPVSELQQARADMEKKGNRLYVCAQKITRKES